MGSEELWKELLWAAEALIVMKVLTHSVIQNLYSLSNERKYTFNDCHNVHSEVKSVDMRWLNSVTKKGVPSQADDHCLTLDRWLLVITLVLILCDGDSYEDFQWNEPLWIDVMIVLNIKISQESQVASGKSLGPRESDFPIDLCSRQCTSTSPMW